MKSKIMVSILLFQIMFFFTRQNFGQIVNFNWVNGIGNSYEDGAAALDVDSLGNIYMIGTFKGTVDFDPGSGIYDLDAQNTTIGDAYILKLNSNGEFIWVKQFSFQPTPPSFTGSFNRIKISGNDIYITGSFFGTVDFDPGLGVFNLTTNGNNVWDAFLLKLDLAGDFKWAQSYGGLNNDMGREIAFDSDKNVYLLGHFSDNADFDFSSNTHSLTSFGAADVFLLKLSPNGNFIWVKQFGGSSNDDFFNLEIDLQNNIYLGGGYFASSEIDMDPGPGVFHLLSNGGWDVPLGKLDSNGDFLWAINLGNSYNDVADFQVNPITNQILLFGNFVGTLDTDPGSDVNNIISNGGVDIYLVALDSIGNYLWSNAFGGSGDDEARYYGGLTIDDAGNIYISGTFYLTVDFDPSNQVFQLESAGLKDIFLSIFNSTGNFINAVKFGSQGDEFASYIFFKNPDLLYLTGSFTNTVDFDPNNGISNLTSNGLSDCYLLSLSSSLTRIAEVEDLPTLKVCPNPAKEYMTIDIGQYYPESEVTVKISNILGQIELVSKISKASSLVDLRTLKNSGVYIITVFDLKNILIGSQKLIKN